MPQRGFPALGSLAPVRVAAEAKGERRWLLAWRGFAAALGLAAYSAVGVVQAVVALAQIAGRPIAGRRPRAAGGPEESAGSGRRALPG